MRLLWVLLLPIIWVPILGLVVLFGSSIPWWGWGFGVLFWILLLRRRAAGRDLAGGDLGPDALRPSPIRGGWM